MTEPKPVRVHARAMIACMVLILCGLGYSGVIPFVSVSCTRSGKIVECVIEKRILGLIPINTTRVNGLAKARVALETGSHKMVGTTDTYYFMFDDATGGETKVMASPFREFEGPVKSVVADINAFLDDDSQDSFSTWFSSLLGWVGLLPVALGGILFLCVVRDMLKFQPDSVTKTKS